MMPAMATQTSQFTSIRIEDRDDLKAIANAEGMKMKNAFRTLLKLWQLAPQKLRDQARRQAATQS
jgi:hypothetical protein